MIFELIEDLGDALSVMPVGCASRDLVSHLQTALVQEAHAVLRLFGAKGTMTSSEFLYQQLRNRVYCNSRGQVDVSQQWTNMHPRFAFYHESPLEPPQFVTRVEADPGTDVLRFRGKVKFSPSGTRVAAAVMREKVRIFDVKQGREVISLKCAGRAVALDFSDDESHLVVAGDRGQNSREGFFEVFDVQTGQSLGCCETELLIHDLALTSYGRVIACTGNTIAIYSLRNLELVREIRPYENSLVYTIARTHDRCTFATGECHDQKRASRITVWDAESFNRLAEFEASKYGILSLAFSDDGLILASGSNHLDSGVVAWQWQAPGSVWDNALLSNATRRDAVQALQHDHASRINGRVVSTARTGDSAVGVAFVPKSSWLVAVEGSSNRTCDTINAFNVFDPEPGRIGKISGHSSVPIAVDVDRGGSRVATLHANAQVALWPADRLKQIAKAPLPELLRDHTTDLNCQLICSRDRGEHGFVYLTDVKTGQLISPGHRLPSMHAAIDPGGRYLARHYWRDVPMNPYPDNSSQGLASRRWWQQFQASTPIQCTLDTISALRERPSPLPDGYSIIASSSTDETVQSWELPKGLRPTNLHLGADGSWGVSLLKDREGLFWLFRFDVRRGRSWTEKLNWPMTAAAVFCGQHPSTLSVAIVRDAEIILRLIEPQARKLRVSRDLLGIGSAKGLTEGPHILSDDRVVIGRNHTSIEVFAPAEKTRSAEGRWKATTLQRVVRCVHDAAIRAMTVTRDENFIVIADSTPSIALMRILDLQLICRRVVDREYETVSVTEDGKILAIGRERCLDGVSYATMNLVESPS